MPKGDSESVLAPVSSLTDGRLGWWDMGLWAMVLAGLSAVGASGLLSLPSWALVSAAPPLLALLTPVAIAAAAPMVLYGLTTALIHWMGRVNRPKSWSALRAARVGMALMPLAWIVGLAALPWIWPALLVVTLIVPVVFALFQRFVFQRFLDRWATSTTISEAGRRRALWLGADIKAVNADDQSVLECAICSGHVGIVQAFADLNDLQSVFGLTNALAKVIEAPGLNEADRIAIVECLFGHAWKQNPKLVRSSLLLALQAEQVATVECLLRLFTHRDLDKDHGNGELRAALTHKNGNALSAIEWALDRADLKTVQLLLGTVDDKASFVSRAPLFKPAFDGRTDFVNWLIEEGGDVGSALAGAAMGGHMGIIEEIRKQYEPSCLLYPCKDPSNRDVFITPLELAARFGHLEMVQGLFLDTVEEERKEGLPADGLPCIANKAAFAAASYGQLAVLKWLLAQHASIKIDINTARNLNGESLLHFAAASRSPGALAVVTWLLDQPGINVNALNKDGQTALHVLDGDDIEVEGKIEVLLEKGVDKTICSSPSDGAGVLAYERFGPEGRYPNAYRWLFVPKTLVEAVRHGDAAAVQLFLEGDVTSKSFFYQPPQKKAKKDAYGVRGMSHRKRERKSVLGLVLPNNENRNLDIAALLLDKKPDLLSKDALHRAIMNVDVDLVKFLVGRGVDANAVDAQSKQAPLLCAVLTKRQRKWRGEGLVGGVMLDVITALVENGARVDIKDSETGASLLHLAASNPDVEIPVLDYLVKQGLTLDATNDAGLNVLQCAVRAGCRPDVIGELVRLGANRAEVDGEGNTLLHLAVEGFKEAVETNGDSARYKPTIEYLLDHGVKWDTMNGAGETAYARLPDRKAQLTEPLLERLRIGKVPVVGAASAGHNLHGGGDAASAGAPGVEPLV